VITKIRRAGNDFGVAVPKALLRRAGFQIGDSLKFEVKDGRVIVTRSKKEVKARPIMDRTITK
jgi:antitoxin component of MazEF toxin-antitoxin module